jgi:hypothetical protein
MEAKAALPFRVTFRRVLYLLLTLTAAVFGCLAFKCTWQPFVVECSHPKHPVVWIEPKMLREPRRVHWMNHLAHFAEFLLVTYHKLGQISMDRRAVDSVVLSMKRRHQTRFRSHFHGFQGEFHHHNLVLLQHVLPNAALTSVVLEHETSYDVRVYRPAGKDMVGSSISAIGGTFDRWGWWQCFNPPQRSRIRPSVVLLDRQHSSGAAHPDRILADQEWNALVASLQAIKSIDINVVAMESMDFRAQMRTAQHADALIGVHGNGLTHELWMRPGSVVVELFTPRIGEGFNNWSIFRSMARAMGHRHHRLLTERNGWMQDVAVIVANLTTTTSLHVKNHRRLGVESNAVTIANTTNKLTGDRAGRWPGLGLAKLGKTSEASLVRRHRR